ncbi:ParA family protein [Williamsia muralis]|uniref:ParA family protein n=1 Tax=Williamsia marianensis TaxID=85044 RepID=UPI003F1788DD
MTARIIAVTNHKGGTAKTTSAVNLASALAAQGRKVLVVDLDSQCNATTNLGAYRLTEDGERQLFESTSADVVLENATAEAAVVSTSIAGLSVIPAEVDLRDIGTAFASDPGRYHVLRSELALIGQDYDYIFIDCPGDTGDLTASALIACNEILVPVAAGAMELEAVVAISEFVDKITKRLNPDARIDHILVGRVNRSQRIDQEIIEALRESFPDELLRNTIPSSVKVTESYNNGQPVTVYAPRSTAALAYVDAARELDARGPKA